MVATPDHMRGRSGAANNPFISANQELQCPPHAAFAGHCQDSLATKHESFPSSELPANPQCMHCVVFSRFLVQL